MQYTIEEMKDILQKHKSWINNEENGKRANLSRADLSGADLSRANLSGANLSGANLSRAEYNETEILLKYFTIGPIGSRNDYLQVFITDKQTVFKVGCFSGNIEEFKQQINNIHKENEHGLNYLAAIEFVNVIQTNIKEVKN